MPTQACQRCGRKTEGDCLLWKGGISRVLCPGCEQEEMQKEQQEKLQKKQQEKQQIK